MEARANVLRTEVLLLQSFPCKWWLVISLVDCNSKTYLFSPFYLTPPVGIDVVSDWSQPRFQAVVDPSSAKLLTKRKLRKSEKEGQNVCHHMSRVICFLCWTFWKYYLTSIYWTKKISDCVGNCSFLFMFLATTVYFLFTKPSFWRTQRLISSVLHHAETLFLLQNTNVFITFTCITMLPLFCFNVISPVTSFDLVDALLLSLCPHVGRLGTETELVRLACEQDDSVRMSNMVATFSKDLKNQCFDRFHGPDQGITLGSMDPTHTNACVLREQYLLLLLVFYWLWSWGFCSWGSIWFLWFLRFLWNFGRSVWFLCFLLGHFFYRWLEILWNKNNDLM